MRLESYLILSNLQIQLLLSLVFKELKGGGSLARQWFCAEEYEFG